MDPPFLRSYFLASFFTSFLITLDSLFVAPATGGLFAAGALLAFTFGALPLTAVDLFAGAFAAGGDLLAVTC